MNKIRFRSESKSSPGRIKSGWFEKIIMWLNSRLGIEFRMSTPTLVKTVWIGFLALIYIYFQHNMDRLIRNTQKIEKEVAEKRAHFISKKSKYLFASKQSEIEKKLGEQGFDNNEPPVIISISNP